MCPFFPDTASESGVFPPLVREEPLGQIRHLSPRHAQPQTVTPAPPFRTVFLLEGENLSSGFPPATAIPQLSDELDVVRVVLLGDHPTMPAVQGLRGNDAGDDTQLAETYPLSFGGRSTRMGNSQPQSASSVQLLEHSQFLLRIIHDLLLRSVSLPRTTNKEVAQLTPHCWKPAQRPPVQLAA